MTDIILKIDGKEAKGKQGDTVLDVCRANDIYVPTLCHLKGLTNVGACRMCVVEIDGERRVNPACTYPARDGLVVRTTTPTLEKHRRMILELLFSERNHFCMFCAQSGDCELQSLAYRYQMDNVRYPNSFPVLPADTLNDYLVLDHNRCILCGRCVRACNEVVGNHTLDFGKRGWRTVICADLEQSMGESTCISCGACVQACPTGALFGKWSAYKGKPSECQVVDSVCSQCGVGCEIKVFTRDNNLVRIDGADLTGVRGQLCRKGRFEPLQESRARVLAPMMNSKKGELEECSMEQALDAVARRLGEIKASQGADAIAGLASSVCTNESLREFGKLLHNVIGSKKVDTLDGDNYRAIAKGIRSYNGKGLDVECRLEDMLGADCIVAVGADALESHPVAGCYMLRALSHKAKLIVIDPLRNSFAYRASLWLKPEKGSEGDLVLALANQMVTEGLGDKGKAKAGFLKGLKKYDADKIGQRIGVKAGDIKLAANMLGKAKHAIVIYGEGAISSEEPDLITSLLNLAALSPDGATDGLRVLSLKPQGNSRGAWELGLASAESFPANSIKAYYVLLADADVKDESLMARLKGADFLVVQSSYHSTLTAMAQVVLPSPTWAEREGEYTTIDGRRQRSKRVLEPKQGIKEDQVLFQGIAKRLTVK